MLESPQFTSHYRTCPLCEAHCGVRIEADTARSNVKSIKADKDNPFSRGFVCPKSSALGELQTDPDRLRKPMRRIGSEFHEVTWDEALDYTADQLRRISKRHGPDSVGVYWGTAGAQSSAIIPYLGMLAQALNTKQIYTAASADNHPKTLVSAFMFGCNGLYTIPDIDRTDYFLIIGANPIVSGGSLMTAAGMPERLRAIRERGGKIVVVDPRRTETAEVADQHLAIRPGTDSFLLFSMLNVLFTERRIRLKRALEFSTGLQNVETTMRGYPPERVAAVTGIAAETIRTLAREFSAAKSAVCYGRVGACTQAFGSLTTWAAELLNILTGNFDEPGGAMFALDSFPMLSYTEKYVGDQAPYGRWKSRVRGFPEVASQFPVAVLAEEIETAGEGQIRALMTLGGNPVTSCPNGERLSRAFAGLDFMFSFDLYLNETTRHSDVIFPPPTHLEKSHLTLVFSQFMVRGFMKYSPAIFKLPDGGQDDWKTLLELTSRFKNESTRDVERGFLEQTIDFLRSAAPRPPMASLDDILRELGKESGPEKFYDLYVRTGAFGEQFGLNPGGLTLDRLRQMPHGIDLGPMRSRCPEALATPDGSINLSPAVIVQDIDRLEARLAEGAFSPEGFLLVGRRQLRSHNSWLHNLPRLSKGGERCTLLMNPKDGRHLDVTTGDIVKVTSKVGSVSIQVEITDEIAPSVVSLPHGWGHRRAGVRMAVATQEPGASYNTLTDESEYDLPSGNAVLTAIRVGIERVRPTETRTVSPA